MKQLALSINGTPVPVPSGIPTGSLEKNKLLIQNAIGLMIFTAVTLAVFFLIWGGIQWIMSGGDKAKVQAARSRITYAIIGLVVTFLSFFIISIVGYFLNLKLFIQ